MFKFHVVPVMPVIFPLHFHADGLLVMVGECTERREHDGAGGDISLRNKE